MWQVPSSTLWYSLIHLLFLSFKIYQFWNPSILPPHDISFCSFLHTPQYSNPYVFSTFHYLFQYSPSSPSPSLLCSRLNAVIIIKRRGLNSIEKEIERINILNYSLPNSPLPPPNSTLPQSNYFLLINLCLGQETWCVQNYGIQVCSSVRMAG